MLRNQNIICISSIDWDFVWQGHQEIMATFAKNGNKVLFIENTGVRIPRLNDIPRLRKRLINWYKGTIGFMQESKNLYIYSPLILPFPYARCARFINSFIFIKPLKRWIQLMEFHEPIVWTFLPTGVALDIIESVGAKLLVYYCIADFSELADPRKVRRTEEEVVKKSDLIFAQGEVLAHKCRQNNDNVHIFPFGVKIETFEDFKLNGGKTPADIEKIKKPIIGYIGGVHKHIDFGLLKFIAKTHPEWSIVLVGPQQTDTSEINDSRNIFLLGKKDFADLPRYISKFDACIIPYQKTEYTNTVYPTKLNEYHALGKPVVSTDLPEVKKFNDENGNLVLIGGTHEEFVDCIAKSLADEENELIERRISSARRNSWFARIDEMSGLIKEALDKKSGIPFDWKENFMRLYKVARRKILRGAFIFLSVYFILFYTPLIWFMAKPLRISQVPQKADCIVVFGGGVGESGKASQGYEERVEHAVQLYRQGYADHLIFSSGYRYFFNEPMIMKALAVSLGVPERAIILEDKAVNTYQNVKLSKEILDKNNWDTALLVSSPYHMRRVSLVFNKIARDVKVNYTPMPNSLFYGHADEDSYGRKLGKKISLEQIRGILHEYLGILYYRFRGWI